MRWLPHRTRRTGVEVAASSASLDWNAKLRVYRRAGVLEYLLAHHRKQVRLAVLQDEEYRPNPLIQRTHPQPHLPGLSLDVRGLLALDTARVLHALGGQPLAPRRTPLFVARLKDIGKLP